MRIPIADCVLHFALSKMYICLSAMLWKQCKLLTCYYSKLALILLRFILTSNQTFAKIASVNGYYKQLTHVHRPRFDVSIVEKRLRKIVNACIEVWWVHLKQITNEKEKTTATTTKLIPLKINFQSLFTCSTWWQMMVRNQMVDCKLDDNLDKLAQFPNVICHRMQLVSHFVIQIKYSSWHQTRALCLIWMYPTCRLIWICVGITIPFCGNCWISSRCSFHHRVFTIDMLAHIHYERMIRSTIRPSFLNTQLSHIYDRHWYEDTHTHTLKLYLLFWRKYAE